MSEKTQNLTIQYTPLSDIKQLPDNFKTHDLNALIKGFQTFGFVDPCGINSETGHNYNGNGRVEALTEMKQRGLDAPRGVEIDQHGEWLVPCVFGVAVDANTEIALAAALNKVNELGGYDRALASEILDNLKTASPDLFVATGFTATELNAMLNEYAKAPNAIAGAEQPPETSFAPTSLPPATVRQVQLFFSPEQFLEFTELCVKLGEQFGTDTPSDTVLQALKEIDEN